MRKKDLKSIIIKLIAILTLFISCSSKKEKKIQLSESEVSIYSNKLITEMNNYNYYFIRTSWNKNNFRKRISQLTKTEKVVLDAYFENFFNRQAIDYSLDYIEVIDNLKGKIYLADSEIIDNTAVLSLVSIYQNNIDFFKLRIEKTESKLWITDLLSLKDNIWISEKLKKIMKLNSKYIASNQNGNRYKANTYYEYSNIELKAENYQKAYNYLDKVPESHTRNFEYSNRKLQIASYISEELYMNTLFEEINKNQYLYLEYLKSYYTNDTLAFKKVLEKVNSKINLEIIPDSLFLENQFWN